MLYALSDLYCVCVCVCTWWPLAQTHPQFVTGYNCFGGFLYRGHFALVFFLDRGNFVSDGFCPGVFLTEGLIVRWLLSGVFLPGTFDLEQSLSTRILVSCIFA